MADEWQIKPDGDPRRLSQARIAVSGPRTPDAAACVNRARSNGFAVPSGRFAAL